MQTSDDAEVRQRSKGIIAAIAYELAVAGLPAEINDYCRCDVLDTYFVFLRSRVLVGKLSIAAEQELVEQTHAWLQERAGGSPAYANYLESWGDWANPWAVEDVSHKEPAEENAAATQTPT